MSQAAKVHIDFLRGELNSLNSTNWKRVDSNIRPCILNALDTIKMTAEVNDAQKGTYWAVKDVCDEFAANGPFTDLSKVYELRKRAHEALDRFEQLLASAPPSDSARHLGMA